MVVTTKVQLAELEGILIGFGFLCPAIPLDVFDVQQTPGYRRWWSDPDRCPHPRPRGSLKVVGLGRQNFGSTL